MSNLKKDFCNLLCDQTDTIVVGFDCDCRVILFNAAAERAFKIAPADAVGQEVSAVLPEQIRDQLVCICQK